MIQIEKRILVINEDSVFCQAVQEQMQNSCTVVGFTEADMKALDAFVKQEWCLDKTTDIEICAAQAKTLIQSYLEVNAEEETRGIIAYGTELLINSRYRQVIADGEPLALTRKEFDLLYCLASYPGQVFSLEHLYVHVWNDESAIAVDEIVKSQIKTI